MNKQRERIKEERTERQTNKREEEIHEEKLKLPAMLNPLKPKLI